MSYVLAIDQGTQSTRAAVLDIEGQIKASASVPIALSRPQPNRVEQDAEQIVQSVQIALDNLFAQLPHQVRSTIEYCGIATQRSTVLSWNSGRGGQATSPAINWQDTRSHIQIENLFKHSYEIKQISGLPLSSHYGASKLHWLMHNCDAMHDQIFGPLSSFLLSRIGNKPSITVDHGNAQRMQLLDIETGEWSRRLLELFDLPVTLLPECRPIYHDYGELKGFGIPITAVNGDQNSAMFCYGMPAAKTALVNIGSGAFVLTSKQCETDISELLSTIAYSDKSNLDYFIEATINGAGNAIQWLCNKHGIQESPSLLQSMQITEPPIFLNTVGGLGSPWWTSGPLPVFVNDRQQYSIPEMLSGVCESILFMIHRNIQVIQKVQTICELHLSGGLSKMDQMCQKLANLSNLPVKRLNDAESTIKGIAWIASGQPKSWDSPSYDLYQPQPDTILKSRFELFVEQLGKYLEETTSR